MVFVVCCSYVVLSFVVCGVDAVCVACLRFVFFCMVGSSCIRLCVCV